MNHKIRDTNPWILRTMLTTCLLQKNNNDSTVQSNAQLWGCNS